MNAADALLGVDVGTATVIAAVIAAIALVAVAVVGLYGSKRLQRIDAATVQINKAVNHVAAGEPTLIQRVRRNEIEMELFRIWCQSALGLIGSQVGVELPKYPPPSGPAEHLGS